MYKGNRYSQEAKEGTILSVTRFSSKGLIIILSDKYSLSQKRDTLILSYFLIFILDCVSYCLVAFNSLICLVLVNDMISISLFAGSPVLGVGFTGALASARPKRGDHRYSCCISQFVLIYLFRFLFP